MRGGVGVGHDYGECLMTCEHTQTDLPVNTCDLLGYAVERRVCYFCGKNTAKEQWPDPATLPIVPVVSVNVSPVTTSVPVISANGSPAPAVPVSPCTGCGKADPAKPYGSPAMIEEALG